VQEVVLLSLDEDTACQPGHSVVMAVLRVLLVDDHQMLTEALAARLSAMDDLWVLGRYTTDDPLLLNVVYRVRPDVIIIDIAPAGPGTAAMLRRLQAAWRTSRVLVLTGTHDPAQAVAAARAGVDAWIPKEASMDELVGALRGVCRGQATYPPEQLGEVLRQLRDDVRQARERSGPLDLLSGRERDVLVRMLDGRPANQIAVELLVSANTVRTHVRHILTKLKVHSRLEAVSVARAAGLRPAEDLADGAAANVRLLEMA
jgi:two-component system, NarL family, response regulator LiaR